MGQQPGGGIGAGIFGGLMQGWIQGTAIGEQQRQKKYESIMHLAAMHARLADEERAKPLGKPELVKYNTDAFYEHMMEAEKQLKPSGPGFGQIMSLFGLGKKKGKKDEEDQGAAMGGMEAPPGGGEPPTPTQADAAAAAPGMFQMGSVTPAQEAPAIGGGRATFLTEGQTPPAAGMTAAPAPVAQQADTGALVGPPATLASVSARERYGLDRLRGEESRPLGYYWKEENKAKTQAMLDQEETLRASDEAWFVKNIEPTEDFKRLTPENQMMVRAHYTSPRGKGMPALSASHRYDIAGWGDLPNSEYQEAYNKQGAPLGRYKLKSVPSGIQGKQYDEKQWKEAVKASNPQMTDEDLENAWLADYKKRKDLQDEMMKLRADALNAQAELRKLHIENAKLVIKAKQVGPSGLNSKDARALIGYKKTYALALMQPFLQYASQNMGTPAEIQRILDRSNQQADDWLYEQTGMREPQLQSILTGQPEKTPAQRANELWSGASTQTPAAPAAPTNADFPR